MFSHFRDSTSQIWSFCKAQFMGSLSLIQTREFQWYMARFNSWGWAPFLTTWVTMRMDFVRESYTILISTLNSTLTLYNFCISIVPQFATMICTTTLGAKIGNQEGNNPYRMLGFLSNHLVGEEPNRVVTSKQRTRRQPHPLRVHHNRRIWRSPACLFGVCWESHSASRLANVPWFGIYFQYSHMSLLY